MKAWEKIALVANLLIAVASILLFSCVLIVLIAFMPEGYFDHLLDALSATGALLAGLATAFLAFLAYRAIGDWEEQTALKHEHRCVSEFRDSSSELKVVFYDIFSFLVKNKVFFMMQNNPPEYVASFLERYENLKKALNVKILSHAIAKRAYVSVCFDPNIENNLDGYDDLIEKFLDVLLELDIVILSEVHAIHLRENSPSIHGAINFLMETGEPIPSPGGGMRSPFLITCRIKDCFKPYTLIRSRIEIRTESLLTDKPNSKMTV
ncbi:MAG: hypothetical protein MJK10_03885 [Pseudomonadales bacterium]|nr:hypothetical protein [Pseudomonadales bacterium]NRA15212.1 hypothetical protein [Oceanospirillaceae bacterium]